MIELGGILIKDETSIVEARNKVRLLAEDLKFGSIEATRLATITSEFSRIVYQNDSESSIVVGLDKKAERFGLVLMFESQKEELNIGMAEVFFDKLNTFRTEDGFQRVEVFRYLQDPGFKPTKRFIDAERERLVRLSRAELLSEVKRKNEELQGLYDDLKKARDHLEVRVQERTAELAKSNKQLQQELNERKRMEEALRLAAQKWRTTFDAIGNAISLLDREGRILQCNKAMADLLRRPFSEVVGHTHWEVVHWSSEPIEECPLAHMWESGCRETRVLLLGDRWYDSTADPVLDEENALVGAVLILVDITNRRKMQEQLIVTDRLASVGKLTAGIAHELNNPLTGVIGFSDLLLEKDVPDDVKEDLKIINSEAKRTAQVVRNLLTFARKHPLVKQPVDINNIIQTVLDLRAYEQKVSNIQVNTQFAPDLPEVVADGFQLQQVFINIIINADYFMIEAHRRGTLTITTERVGDITRASFADDGPGISKENMWHLFDPFFTTKEVGKGTGLGLSISYGIIAEQGGRIYAESELGKGATFVVELSISTPDGGGTKNENSW